MTQQAEGRYDVVWPLGRVTRADGGYRADRLTSFSGKRVSFLWDYLFHGDVIFESIRRQLTKLAPDVEFVDHSVFGNIHGPDGDEFLERLPARLAAERVDAAIVAVGA
jgi:hypothetical protein